MPACSPGSYENPLPMRNLRVTPTYSNMLYMPSETSLSAASEPLVKPEATPEVKPLHAGRPDASPLARSARKERMTFRVPADLARSLRQLPNQTAFVERALRESLEQLCPLCHGTGHAVAGSLTVSDLKRDRLGRLDRQAAEQLRALVRLGRELLATELRLRAGAAEGSSELAFELARNRTLLLSGRICRGESRVVLPHGPPRNGGTEEERTCRR